MKTIIAFIVAVAILAMGKDWDTPEGALVLMDGAAYRDLHVPIRSSMYTMFVFPVDEAHKEGVKPEVEYGIDFETWSVGRTITLDISVVGCEYNYTSLLFDKSGTQLGRLSEVPEAEVCCVDGCTIEFKLTAECTGASCVNDITTTQWIRMRSGNGTYLYSTDAVPYMRLRHGFWSPPLNINGKGFLYFEFDVPAADQFYMEKESEYANTIMVVGGGTDNNRPDPNNYPAWTTIDNKFYRRLNAGVNYIALYATDPELIEGRVSFFIGASPALAVPVLLMALFSVFAALF